MLLLITQFKAIGSVNNGYNSQTLRRLAFGLLHHQMTTITVTPNCVVVNGQPVIIIPIVNVAIQTRVPDPPVVIHAIVTLSDVKVRKRQDGSPAGVNGQINHRFKVELLWCRVGPSLGDGNVGLRQAIQERCDGSGTSLATGLNGNNAMVVLHIARKAVKGLVRGDAAAHQVA